MKERMRERKKMAICAQRRGFAKKLAKAKRRRGFFVEKKPCLYGNCKISYKMVEILENSLRKWYTVS